MKIAILSPIAWRTPPQHYGPWEQVASNITEGLADRNIDVTLFATGDSITSAQLEWVCEKPYADNPAIDAKVNECLHISHLFQNAHRYDLIHNHYDFLPLTFSSFVNTPLLTTIHGFSSPLIVPVFKKYNARTHYISISNANRHPELDYLATVYNGIDTAAFSFCAHPGDYLLFFGRIHPDKGAKEAIEISRQAGKKIILAGLIQDHNYFSQYIQPFINDHNVIYAGNCNPHDRNVLLGKAIALLHPISFDEPFGLSVVEAMCCGTPVIAFNRGAMPELVQHNINGFLVQNIAEAVSAIAGITNINRKNCRATVIEKFSKEKMTDDYINVYHRILGY